MKKFIQTLLFVLFTITLANAQTIETKKRIGGLNFYQNGKALNLFELVPIMKPNQEAFLLIKRARNRSIFAGLISGVGGALAGVSIITGRLGGGGTDWTSVAIGTGLIVAIIPISRGINKNAQKAVDIYNAELSFIENKSLTQINFISKGNQIGILLQF